MSNYVEVHKRWRGFTAEKSKARRVVQEQIDAKNEAINQLREEIVLLDTQFVDEWRHKKEALQRERDEAVMEALATGLSAQRILRELNSNNTVWIYGLRGQVMAANGIPEPGNVNSYTPPEEREAPTAQVEFREPE